MKTRKLAPGRFSRAIVALAKRIGNKTVKPNEDVSVGQGEEVEAQTDNRNGQVKFKRTTITVERERLLKVRIGRRSST